jgi:hypothetical protein
MEKEVIVDERELAANGAESPTADADITSTLPKTAALATRFWWKVYSIAWGTTLAGTAYPVIFAFIGLLFALISEMSQGWRSFRVGEAAWFIGSAITLGALAGFIWTMGVCICILPIVYFFVRSLGLRGSVVRLGAFSGGLVGYIAVMPFFLSVLLEGGPWWWQLALGLLVGPALTTALGQIGGAWGAKRVGSYERAVAKDWANRQLAAEHLTEMHSAASDSAPSTRFQFRIWHLLVISIWISLMLTAIRLMGIDFTFAFALIIGWTLYQEVTLRLGKLLAARLGPWWARRKTRST